MRHNKDVNVMDEKMKRKPLLALLVLLHVLAVAGCNDTSEGANSVSSENATSVSGDSLPNASDMFTNRDLEQTPDTSTAVEINLNSGENVTIIEEGVYVLTGDVENVSIVVEADKEAKVQTVLAGVSVTNQDAPVLYVKSADKVFVTIEDGDNYMEVSGAYAADGETNLDAVIFSKDDLVLNGTGSLVVLSAQGNGITSKDDLKITGGSIAITSALDSLEANDSIRIAGGELTIDSAKDALHSENEEDDSLGYIYTSGGTLNISAADDGIRATSTVQIDGGAIDIETSGEGIEATYIQINDGNISVYATDDGINATSKSSAYSVLIEVNGGTIYVEVGSGDTDGFDSNGDIHVSGGTIEVTASSAFDFDGSAELVGGSVTVNGELITEITASMMGPGGNGRR